MFGTVLHRNRTSALAAAACAVIGVVTAGTVAFACTASATLTTDPAEGTIGSSVGVTGNGYAAAGPPVAVRWGGAAGTLLAQVAPDATGAIATRVTVPANAAAGHYIITAVQKGVDERGAAVSWSRSAAFQVLGDPAPAVAPQP
ncbi:MAG: hypothetical protein ACRD1K_10160, partial [Acidimicrobiales bacterium]